MRGPEKEEVITLHDRPPPIAQRPILLGGARLPSRVTARGSEPSLSSASNDTEAASMIGWRWLEATVTASLCAGTRQSPPGKLHED
jgi:hypothetical protein